MADFVAQELEQRVIAGDIRALARAASLIEGQTSVGRDLIAALFPRTGRAMIVGVTGPPGAGKSTVVDQLVKVARRAGRTTGVIAVDPSSPFSNGAILGDRIRMQDHYDDPGVFIRSMASRGRLGGLAKTTLEMAMLFDAAGRNILLVETVGVGQDEVDVARLADVTVLVLAPGFGDDIQAMKAGIMEVADLFAVNKADLPGADRLEQDIRAMQSVGTSSQAGHAASIRRLIASQGSGVNELFVDIHATFEIKGRQSSRAETWICRLRQMLRDDVLTSLPDRELALHAELVANKQQNPYTALSALHMYLAENKSR